jgi:hypothetical protein
VELSIQGVNVNVHGALGRSARYTHDRWQSANSDDMVSGCGLMENFDSGMRGTLYSQDEWMMTDFLPGREEGLGTEKNRFMVPQVPIDTFIGGSAP